MKLHTLCLTKSTNICLYICLCVCVIFVKTFRSAHLVAFQSIANVPCYLCNFHISFNWWPFLCFTPRVFFSFTQRKRAFKRAPSVISVLSAPKSLEMFATLSIMLHFFFFLFLVSRHCSRESGAFSLVLFCFCLIIILFVYTFLFLFAICLYEA